ncbi:excitatory amino acid transporter-like isoform X1 [Dermacentor variabilis]|uniref:excitatory amino acid transporter-like isoform X1 n=1 Tax=Dermacentor variabilis TaxID=34621 RepID=UPI003F5AE76A
MLQNNVRSKPGETRRDSVSCGKTSRRSSILKGSPAVKDLQPQQLRRYGDGQKQPQGVPAGQMNAVDEREPQQQAQEGMSSRVLPLLMVAGISVGALLGCIIRVTDRPWSRRQIMYVSFPGELFQRMMTGVSTPLMSSSVVAALASSRLSVMGRVGLCALFLSLLCKCLAVAGAIGIAAFLTPGHAVRLETDLPYVTPDMRLSAVATDRLLDLIRNLFPSNIISAHMKAIFTFDDSAIRGSDGKRLEPNIKTIDTAVTNQLGLLSFSILLGLMLSAFRQEQNVVLNVFVSLSNALVTATHMLMWLAPVGLCSITMGLVLRAKDLQVLVGDLYMYLLTFVAAIALHGLLVLPALYLMLTRGRLGLLFRNMVQPISVAYGLSSSSATVPTLIVALEEGLQMDPRLARCLVPVGSTVNMDGMAIYFTVTLIFFAQKEGMTLSPLQYTLIGLTSGLASLSIGYSPLKGVMLYLLQAFDVPFQNTKILVYTDWFTRRMSFALNVITDTVVASGTQSLCRAALNAVKTPDVVSEIAGPDDADGQPQ